jgi:hypothetical protein
LDQKCWNPLNNILLRILTILNLKQISIEVLNYILSNFGHSDINFNIININNKYVWYCDLGTTWSISINNLCIIQNTNITKIYLIRMIVLLVTDNKLKIISIN